MNNLNNKNKNDSGNNEFLENKEKSNNNISIVDFQQDKDKRIEITSPRSLLALKICGYKQEELKKISLDEFINTYPEIKNISKEFQEHRYFYFDKNREEKISKVIDIRQQIIDEKLKEENKSINKKENESSLIENSRNLNKSNSYISMNFNKTLKHYALISHLKNTNQNNNNLNYISFQNKSVSDVNSPKDPHQSLSIQSQKILGYYKLKNENEFLNILSNEINRKLLKQKLLDKEFIKCEYEKQKKQQIEERKFQDKKRMELVRSAKFRLMKEKEEKALKDFQEKEKKRKMRLEQEKQKSREKEKEYQEKNLERRMKINNFKIKKEKEHDEIQTNYDEKLKKMEENEKQKLMDLMKHRELIEQERKIQYQKTKELIQKRDYNILSKSQDIMESYLNKEQNTEKVLQKIEKERIQNYLIKKNLNNNMKIERDKKIEEILKLKEEMIFKNKLRMKKIEERQNLMDINKNKLKEEKRIYYLMEEMKRNQKIKMFEEEINNKKINLLENIKNKENKYKEICKKRDDIFKKKCDKIPYSYKALYRKRYS